MFAEGEVPYNTEDFRFTYKKGVLYAFQMKPSKEILIKSLHTDRCGTCIESVDVLGANVVTSWVCDHEGLKVTLANEPVSEMPQCLKIVLK